MPEELFQIHFLSEGYTVSNTGSSFISGTQPAIHTALLTQKEERKHEAIQDILISSHNTMPLHHKKNTFSSLQWAPFHFYGAE